MSEAVRPVPGWEAPPGTVPASDPMPLLILPLPCDARLTVALLDAIAKAWESDHLGEAMTVAHWEQREASEFGKVLIVWDQPVDQPKESDVPVQD